MADTGRALFDPSTIRGRYSLLAAFLVAIEALLALWMGLAGGERERIVAGALMAVMLLAFLAVVVILEKARARAEGAPLPEDFPDVAKGKVSEEEVANPAQDQIAGPDGSYVIDQPPDGWTVEVVSFFDWISANMGVTDPATKAKLMAQVPIGSLVTSDPTKPDVLVLTSNRRVEVAPLPGTTKINGRRAPSALTSVIETRLAVIPMARARAPLYEERTTLQNFLVALAQVFQSGVVQVRELKTGTTDGGRTVVSAELTQEIEDATVDGKPGRSVRSNLIAVGIQGDVRDYLLMMNYPSVIGEEPPAATPELEALQRLSASFRPLRVANVEQRRAELAALADERFAEFLAASGRQIFFAEIAIVLMRVAGLDLEDAEDRLQAIRSLRPFRDFAAMIELEEAEREEFERLWEQIELADQGDARGFKEHVGEILAQFSGGGDEPEAVEEGEEVAALPEAGEADEPEPDEPPPDPAGG